MNTHAAAFQSSHSTQSCGAQLALFLPTAESYASARGPVSAPCKRGAKKQVNPKAQTACTWLPVTLADLTPEEVAAAPSNFRELCRVVTVDEAAALCEAFGGLKLRIPPPEEGSRWRNSEWRKQFRDLLSPASYENLLREMGGSGGDFIFPRLERLRKQRRNQRIRDVVDSLIAQKKPYLKTLQAIAVAEGMNMSNIYKILKQSS